MTGYIRVHCGTWNHLWNIGRSSSFEGYICGFWQQNLKSDHDTSNQWAIGQGQSGYRCKYGGGYGNESEGGFRNGNGGATEKSKVTVGLEVEIGVAMDVQTDSEWTVDSSGTVGVAAGAKAGVGSVMASTGAEMKLLVVGTDTKDDAVVVARVEVCMIVEMIPSACGEQVLGASKCTA